MTEYTGPTSGRVTIGGDGTVNKETFHDLMPTRDEEQAVAWFTALSPNEGLREVRRLKWNGEESERQAKVWRAAAKRLDAEIAVLRKKLAAVTPDGFTLPKAAEDLISHATAHGWKTDRVWEVREEGDAFLRIALGNGSWEFRLAWSCDSGGGGRMTHGGLARSPGRPWYGAPSLTRIREIITENTSAPTN